MAHVGLQSILKAFTGLFAYFGFTYGYIVVLMVCGPKHLSSSAYFYNTGQLQLSYLTIEGECSVVIRCYFMWCKKGDYSTQCCIYVVFISSLVWHQVGQSLRCCSLDQTHEKTL